MKKQKVINVTYRKDSVSFNEWMKYEITLIDEEGDKQVIPAYGKDLQDALSRVVHDKKVVEVEKRVRRIPEIIWVILWFGYIVGLMEFTYLVSPYDKFNGTLFLGGMSLITLITLWGKTWFRMRNTQKEYVQPPKKNHIKEPMVAISNSGSFGSDLKHSER